jgi:nodulation protein E
MRKVYFGRRRQMRAFFRQHILMSMVGRRVVITGMGVVSAVGEATSTYRLSLLDCRSGIGPRTQFDETWMNGGVPHLAAEVRLSDDTPAIEGLDRFSRFAVLAAEQALREAGPAIVEQHRDRAAVIIGTAVGGDNSRDLASYRVFKLQRRPHPMTIARTMANAAVSAITIAFGFRGPAFNISTACASSAHAIGEAARMIRFGLTDFAVAGGAESLPSLSLYNSWCQMKVLSPDGCRPFAMDRNGIILGEGAGIVALEPLEQALHRGATIYAEVAGFGMSADASDWVVPQPEGMLRAMREALRDAGLSSDSIGYINAHGTGTEIGDAAEAEALGQLLGAKASQVPVSSTKALHGHALGAGGALEIIATALGLREGWAPPMPDAPRDPALSLNLVIGAPVPFEGAVAMSNSFGFGGLNASIVLVKPDSDSLPG